MKHVEAAIAIVTRSNHILVCQRHDNDTFGGYWEFPGGKRENGETLEQCLARELMEELAIAARPVAQLTVIEHDYPHARIRLVPFICELDEGDPRTIECQAIQWIDPQRLKDFRFPPANDALLDEVIAYFATPIPATIRPAPPPPSRESSRT